MEKREKSQTVQLRLRIRESLRARLEKVARRSGMSLNDEVERRLEASFDDVVSREEYDKLRTEWHGFMKLVAAEHEARIKDLEGKLK
jgi:hypothetical protein